MQLELVDIHAAAERIAPYVVRTPALCVKVDNVVLATKPECLQPIGAFKLRGAFNMMLQLPPSTPGVVAHSSGNHAQAVARAARVLGISATIVMPSDAPPNKRARVVEDGAEVVEVGTDSEERRLKADAIAAQTGRVLVPPYDHPYIAAGQGTAAVELVEDVGTLQRFYAPVSGGGLMAGCATAIAALSPGAEIVGVEPVDANDTFLSLQKGERTIVPPPRTIADGLRVRTPGKGPWPVLQRLLSRIELVTDEELLDTMAWALVNLRVVLEPSGAASLAVARREAAAGTGTFGVLLSGGNVHPDLWPEVVQRAIALTPR